MSFWDVEHSFKILGSFSSVVLVSYTVIIPVHYPIKAANFSSFVRVDIAQMFDESAQQRRRIIKPVKRLPKIRNKQQEDKTTIFIQLPVIPELVDLPHEDEHRQEKRSEN